MSYTGVHVTQADGKEEYIIAVPGGVHVVNGGALLVVSNQQEGNQHPLDGVLFAPGHWVRAEFSDQPED